MVYNLPRVVHDLEHRALSSSNGRVSHEPDGVNSAYAQSVPCGGRFLSVGKSAPDIEGDDQDGKSFKLSNYRGKVVLLYFWQEY